MRHLVWIVLLAALVPAIAAPSLPAQNAQATTADHLTLGSVELNLGMDEKPALAALRAKFHVERARGTGEDWAVQRDGRTFAVVSFDTGKLARASKTWYSSSAASAMAMTEQLYSLAGEFAGDGRTQCTLSAKPYRLEGIKGKIVTLACGRKSIQFNESRVAHGGVATSLREVLQ